MTFLGIRLKAHISKILPQSQAIAYVAYLEAI